MSNMIFPTLPGLMWDIQKHALYSTEVMRSVSGKEVRAAFYSNPIWEWSLKFEFLRGYNAYTEFAQLQSFFSRLQGPYDSFLWSEPGDASVSAHGFGVGDGTTTAFQLQRMLSPAPLQLSYWDTTAYTPSTTPRTNLVLQSGDFTQAVWTKNSLTDGGAQVDPSGLLAARLYTASAGGATIAQTISGLVPGQTYTVSLWMLCAAGTTLRIGTTEGTSAAVTLTAAYQRVPFTFTAAGTSTVFTIGAGASWGNGVAVQVAFSQGESGSVATPYIGTAAAAVTVTPNYWPKGGDGFEPVYNLNPATPLQVYRSDWQGNQRLYQTSRTNLIQQSGDLNNAAWTKTRLTTSTGNTGPDGGSTAAKLIEDATASSSHFALSSAWTALAQAYTGTCYLKAGTRTVGWLSLDGTAAVWFDLSAGTVSFQNSGCTGSIQSVGGGWYRCTITQTQTAGSKNFLAGPAISSGSYVYTGDGASYIYAFGGQVESGSISTSYIPTTSSAVTTTDFTVSSGLVTFTNAPVSGASLTWTGAWFWRVRFKDDKLDFNQFASNFWELKKMDFVSIK